MSTFSVAGPFTTFAVAFALPCLPYHRCLLSSLARKVDTRLSNDANTPHVLHPSHLGRLGELPVVDGDAGLLAQGRFAQEHDAHVDPGALRAVRGAHVLPAGGASGGGL